MLTSTWLISVLLSNVVAAHPGVRILGGFNAVAAIKSRTGSNLFDASFDSPQRTVNRRAENHVVGPLNERQSNSKCGPGYGACQTGFCCSIDGACGKGFHYCSGPACQLSYGDACDGNQSPPGASTKDVPRPKIGNVSYSGKGISACTNPNTVALTFDDGPYIYTTELLALLASYNAKATFFITGNNMGKGEIDNVTTGYPQIIQKIYAAGHQIAHHTWTHQNLTDLTVDQRDNQMYFNEMALRNVLGFFPTYLRPPYSDCGDNCQATMDRLGYHIVYENLNTLDYLNDDPTLIQTSKDIVNQQFATVNSKYPAKFIPITHDIHEQTVHNLTSFILERMKALGFGTSVTVGDCLGDPKENWYRKADGAPSDSPANSSIPASLLTITPTAIPDSGPSTTGGSSSATASPKKSAATSTTPTPISASSLGKVSCGLMLFIALISTSVMSL